MAFAIAAYYLIPVIAVIWGFRKYNEFTWGSCTNRVQLNGKIAVVTGASSGIGFEIAKELAKRQAKVIMACRSLSSAAQAIRRLKKELNCSNIVPMELDLASVKSIKQFCQEFKSTYSTLDILVNNAGIAYPDASSNVKTKNNLEIHFGVNHLGHYLLTKLLLDHLKAARESRVVIISSKLHEKGSLDLKTLNSEENIKGYSNSKLANVYFGRELAKRMHNSNVYVYTVCPGWVYTNLFRNYNWKWYEYLLVLPVALLFMRSPNQGAQTAIYCATEPQLQNESGHMYRDCKKYKSKMIMNDDVSARLWDLSENVLKKIYT